MLSFTRFMREVLHVFTLHLCYTMFLFSCMSDTWHTWYYVTQRVQWPQSGERLFVFSHGLIGKVRKVSYINLCLYPGLGSVRFDSFHSFKFNKVDFLQYSYSECHQTRNMKSRLKASGINVGSSHMFRMALNLVVTLSMWEKRGNDPTPLFELPLLVRMVIFSL